MGVELAACLFYLGILALIALGSTFLTFLLACFVRDVFPLGIAVGLACLFWPLCFLALGRLVVGAFTRAERRWQRQFLARPILSDEEFAHLFPQQNQARVIAFRRDLAQFLQRDDLTYRLLPSDPISPICLRMGANYDQLDWADWVLGMEKRYDVRFSDDWDLTIGQMVDALAQPINRGL